MRGFHFGVSTDQYFTTRLSLCCIRLALKHEQHQCTLAGAHLSPDQRTGLRVLQHGLLDIQLRLRQNAATQEFKMTLDDESVQALPEAVRRLGVSTLGMGLTLPVTGSTLPVLLATLPSRTVRQELMNRALAAQRTLNPDLASLQALQSQLAAAVGLPYVFFIIIIIVGF